MQARNNSTKPVDTRIPDIQVRLSDKADKLKKDGRFLCNVRFVNDLPEIPSDPKMLVAPLNQHELAAFKLTTLEKNTKHDLLFQPDLGIAITPLDIECYAVPANVQPIHPKDDALLGTDVVQVGNGLGGVNARRAKARGEAADASWLLRTKYITNELLEGSGKSNAATTGVSTPATEEPPPSTSREDQIAGIENSFDAATKPPVHPKKPDLVPVEVLPVLPDTMLADWQCVVAAFDGNPIEGVDRINNLPEAQKQRLIQAAQLKSLARKKADGSSDRFVAFMLPSQVPPEEEGPTDTQPGIALKATSLQGDYDWIREYDSNVRFEDKGDTYLLRRTGDHVAYLDLNTRVALKKRKRQLAADEEPFLQPEKFILRLPGSEEEEVEEEAVEEQQQQQQQQDGDGDGATAVDAVEQQPEEQQTNQMTAAIMRDVFGDDDDDDDY